MDPQGSKSSDSMADALLVLNSPSLTSSSSSSQSTFDASATPTVHGNQTQWKGAAPPIVVDLAESSPDSASTSIELTSSHSAVQLDISDDERPRPSKRAQNQANGTRTTPDMPDTPESCAAAVVTLMAQVRKARVQVGPSTPGVLLPQNIALDVHLWAQALDMVEGFVEMADSLKKLTEVIDMGEKMKIQVERFTNLQQEIAQKTMDPAQRDARIEVRDNLRVELAKLKAGVQLDPTLMPKIISAAHASKEAMAYLESICSETDILAAEEAKQYKALSPIAIENALFSCTCALTRQKEWRKQNDTDALQAISKHAIQAISDLKLTCDEETLQERHPDLQAAQRALRSELICLTRLTNNNISALELPLSQVTRALAQVYLLYMAAHSRLKSTHQALSLVKMMLAGLSTDRKLPEMDTLKSLEHQILVLHGELFSLEAQTNQAATALRNDKATDAEAAVLQRELEEQKQGLKAARSEVLAKVEPLLEAFKSERCRLEKILRSSYPELLFRPENQLVHGFDSRDLSFLNLRSRPDAELLLRDIEKVTLKLCPVCFEQVESSKGIECANHHFMCDECLGQHLQTVTEPGYDGALAEADGRLPCYDVKCDSKPHTAKELAGHVNDAAYESYMRAVVRCVESKTVREVNSRWTKDIEKRRREDLEKGTIAFAVQKHVEHITENILTTKCPHGHAFVDFNGCAALTCHICKPKSNFCAWCLADCGKDAHTHVAYCSSNPNRITVRGFAARQLEGEDQSYFGSEKQFQQVRAKRCRAKMKKYWLERVVADPPAVQRGVLDLVQAHLKDINLPKWALKVVEPKQKKARTSSALGSTPTDPLDLDTDSANDDLFLLD